MKLHYKFLTILVLISLIGCSSSQETINKEEGQKEEIYVFDDMAAEIPAVTDSVLNNEVKKDSLNFVRDDMPKIESEIVSETYYIVQVGAFSTKEKADYFVNENQKEIEYKMEVTYSPAVNLFVVWLPKFSSKTEAENVRNIIWKKEKFKDAFIVTIE